MRKKLTEVQTSEILVKRIAAMAATGATVKEISEIANISVAQTRNVMSREDFKQALSEIGDEATKEAKVFLRAEVSRMAKEIVRVLYANLADNNLEAVKVAAKMIGMGDEEVKQQDTTLHVHLPGGSEIEVESKVLDEPIE